MSDKEKLDYFLRLLDDNFTLKTYAGIELTYEDLHYLTEKLAKEIEYRERVQKLEEENKRIRQMKYHEAYEQGKFDTNMKVWYEMPKLEQQNKRYREALEFIGNHANESDMMDNVMYTQDWLKKL